MEGIAAGVVIAGKYRLERPLAQGGMGAVWAAFDKTLEVPVAVKFMAPALTSSAELVGRFEREAKAAAQLRSPHVVQVFEHGVDRGVPYIVMERLEGEDLGTRIKKRGRLSLWEAALILEQVCKALRKAHEAGIVHRDLKPGNIFLVRQDEDEIVKVLDFGIAKSSQPATSGDGTRTGIMMGSPSYMSPEQARSSKAVDHRSDLWSLGLVMFRVVTGKLAFTGETDTDTIVRLCMDPVPVPSQIVPDLPPEVDAWFARALSRDLDQRFQSAREMAAAFGKIVGRLPSVGEQPATSASIPAGGVLPARPAPETTRSDVAQTIPLAPQGLQALRKTLPLPGARAAEVTAPLPVTAPAEVTAPLPEVQVQVGGATLTNAGAETAAPVAVASRGWRLWVLGGAGAIVLAAAGLFAIRGKSADGAPTSPRATVATATSVESAPVVTSTATPAAEPSANPAATAEPTPATAATADAGVIEPAESSAQPVVSATASATAAVRPDTPRTRTTPPSGPRQPAVPRGDPLGDIPRVLKKSK